VSLVILGFMLLSVMWGISDVVGDIIYGMANRRYDSKDYRGAMVYYNKCLWWDWFGSNAAIFHNRLGDCHDELKEYDAAIAEYSIAIALKPQRSLYLYNRGQTCADAGKYDQALTDLNAAIALTDSITTASAAGCCCA
jgi:tetratricopeptide (TPR) repeat protein